MLYIHNLNLFMSTFEQALTTESGPSREAIETLKNQTEAGLEYLGMTGLDTDALMDRVEQE